MAFNLKTFQTRTLTAIVFATVMLTGLLWNHWSFLVLFSIIHFGCWWEYFNLLERIYHTSIHRYLRLGFLLSGFAIMLLFCGPAYEINNYQLKENFSFPVSVAGFIFLGMGIFQSKRMVLKAFIATAIGLVYISLCWGLMVDIRQEGLMLKGESVFSDFGKLIPLLIIISIWINDTMAYLAGSLFGKTPLSKISPQKTLEGTIGGAIFAILIMGISGPLIFNTNVINTGLIAAIASIFSIFGDLFQSKLKRMAGVKDSGSFMPGHGGFLDRFDSMLFATPAVWLYAMLFLK